PFIRNEGIGKGSGHARINDRGVPGTGNPVVGNAGKRRRGFVYTISSRQGKLRKYLIGDLYFQFKSQGTLSRIGRKGKSEDSRGGCVDYCRTPVSGNAVV